jgi:site-specific recombinase XerD
MLTSVADNIAMTLKSAQQSSSRRSNDRFVADLTEDGTLSLLHRTHSAAVETLLEILSSRHANVGTRSQYKQALRSFLDWMKGQRFTSLADLRASDLSAWRDDMLGHLKPLSIQSRFAAVRSLFDDLVVEGILQSNPAARVKVMKGDYSVGKTSTLSAAQVRRLLDSIEPSTLIGLRDRALIATLMYSTLRISATLGLTPNSLTHEAGGTCFRVIEKRNKHRLVPVHEQLFPLLEAWVDAADLRSEPDLPIFRAFGRKSKIEDGEAHPPLLRPTALVRQDAWQMIQRRSGSIGLTNVSCHTFRATGLTVALLNGASLDEAQDLAGHASVATTRLYDRRKDRKMVATVNRIRF